MRLKPRQKLDGSRHCLASNGCGCIGSGQPLRGRLSGTLAGMLNLWEEFRALNAAQRRAFAAAFFGWALDGFDFTILTFVLADIQ